MTGQAAHQLRKAVEVDVTAELQELREADTKPSPLMLLEGDAEAKPLDGLFDGGEE